MIHYHGTPCGGQRMDVARFLAGRHALIPFPRPEDIGTAAEICQSFCIDNGAFTIWKQGGKLDIHGYIDFVAKWSMHPAFDWALIPDVIDGTETENEELIRRWPKHLRGVPVWHLHESLFRLGLMIEDDRWPIIAIGSSGEWPNPGERKWWDRMQEVMGVACNVDGQPLKKLHGLRMLDPAIFCRLPLASADSTNAVRNSSNYERFGMYCPPNNSTRMTIIAERIEAHQSPAVWVPMDRQRVLTWEPENPLQLS